MCKQVYYEVALDATADALACFEADVLVVQFPTIWDLLNGPRAQRHGGVIRRIVTQRSSWTGQRDRFLKTQPGVRRFDERDEPGLRAVSQPT